MEGYERLLEWLRNIFTLTITCRQWGDSGKGKIVDLLAYIWAEIIIRGTGGGNAGHTMVINGKTYIMHLIPCGILHDKENKINAIGRGVAFDPSIACSELDILDKENISYQKLMIALNAKLVLPQHLVMDRIEESDSDSGKIGTTGRGMGPVYSDHVKRIGLIVNDLLNPDVLARKLERNLKPKIRLLKTYDPVIVSSIMDHPHLKNGLYHHPKNVFDVDAIIYQYGEYAKRLEPFIRDVDAFVRQNVGKTRTLLEGAQGDLLSINKGTYPFVTPSDSTITGLADGAGLDSTKQVDENIGIMKAFYITRVGEGPFPTEIGGKRSDEWCNSKGANRQVEIDLYPQASVNSIDEYLQGIGIRQVGGEYGATTERPRRCGWFDDPLTNYVIPMSGPHVILTKLDVLNQCKTIKICTAYRYVGPRFKYGQQVLNPGDIIKVAIPNSEVLQHCQPIYQEFPGWECDLKGVTSINDLPTKFRDILDFVVKETKIKPLALSIGKEREDNIFL